jgi:hypothetical protein
MISTLNLHIRQSALSLNQMLNATKRSTVRAQHSWKSLWNTGLDGLQSSGSERSLETQPLLSIGSPRSIIFEHGNGRSCDRQPSIVIAKPGTKRHSRRKLHTSAASIPVDDDGGGDLAHRLTAATESSPLLRSTQYASLQGPRQSIVSLTSCPDLHRPFEIPRRGMTAEVGPGRQTMGFAS